MPPLPEAAQAPAPHPSKAGAGLATAKTESCLSTAALVHEGQETASPKRRTSFSKPAPQSRQTYSYSGMAQAPAFAAIWAFTFSQSSRKRFSPMSVRG
jgi:hypothetical protein